MDEGWKFKIQHVPVCDLKPGPNIRKEAPPDEIAVLAASLKVQQLHPIIVTPDLAIVDGWRRWLAAQEAGIKCLWAVITNRQLSKDERIAAQLAMALHRKDFTEQEKVLACEELLASAGG